MKNAQSVNGRHYTREGVGVTAICIALSLISTAHAGDIIADIQKNQNIVQASLASGPCNPNNSIAKREVFKNGKWMVDQHPLDCHFLITEHLLNGRLLFTFIGNNDAVGFGSDGKQHQDENGRPFVEIDHFYPPDHPASWKLARNRYLGAYGQCMWAPHKDNKQLTVVLCAVDYSPLKSNQRSLDTSQHYSWAIEITKERSETIKGENND